jgi:hypothetical protein
MAGYSESQKAAAMVVVMVVSMADSRVAMSADCWADLMVGWMAELKIVLRAVSSVELRVEPMAATMAAWKVEKRVDN